MKKITIFIPGFFGPDIAVHPDDALKLPALNWFLTRGRYKKFARLPPSDVLCQLFGVATDAKFDAPIAAITRLADDVRDHGGNWLRADPIHIMPDRHGLILLDSSQFSLARHDALLLAKYIKTQFRDDVVELEVPDPYRWYIQLHGLGEVRTTPLDAMAGQHIMPFMPHGNSSAYLIQLMNDIQMVLHDAQVNKQREQNQLLPINSLWFWGYGQLPKTVTCPWSFVIGDGQLSKGLAMLADIPFSGLPGCFDDIAKHILNENALIVSHDFLKYSDYNDLEGWLSALVNYEKNWFVPLLYQLKNNALDSLQIQTTQTKITIDRICLYQFWKRSRSLHEYKRMEMDNF